METGVAWPQRYGHSDEWKMNGGKKICLFSFIPGSSFLR